MNDIRLLAQTAYYIRCMLAHLRLKETSVLHIELVPEEIQPLLRMIRASKMHQQSQQGCNWSSLMQQFLLRGQTRERLATSTPSFT